MNDDSSMDSDTKSYNDIPLLEDVVKVKRDFHPMTPSKKVFDVTLPNTKTSIDNHSDNMDEPSKLDFTDAYEEA